MTLEQFQQELRLGIPDTLPALQPYDPTVNHAPKRKEILTPDEKRLAIRNALRYFPAKHHAMLAKEFAEELTGREKDICTLMVEGLTNRQIADRLYISEGTVKNYISNIYDKTGIHDRVKLIVELKG